METNTGAKYSKYIYVILGIWIVITLLRVFFHQPWYDEAHAWMLARDYNFIDLIAQMKYEGHTFVWYLLLMPFAKLNLLWPYPMLIINWLFAFLALFIFLKNAPFNPIIKTLVAFSYPFLAQLPVIARCYSIGVLCLFLLTDLYKKRLVHPINYSLLIFICANTSVMALFGAFAFGIIFAYDLIKAALEDKISRKAFTVSFVILALCAVMVFWQLGRANADFISPNNNFIQNILTFFTGIWKPITVLNIVSALFLFFAVPCYCFKDKRIFLIYIIPIAFLLYVFNFTYGGTFHHYVFLLVYALIALWLINDARGKDFPGKIIETFVGLLFLGQIFSIIPFQPNTYTSASRFMADNFLSQISDARIILTIEADKRLIPYAVNSDIYFYCSATKADSDSTIYETPLCEYGSSQILPSWLHKSLSDKKDNYIITVVNDEIPETGFVLEDKYYKMKFEPYKILNKTYGMFKVIETVKNQGT